jgi:hypothetical protein
MKWNQDAHLQMIFINFNIQHVLVDKILQIFLHVAPEEKLNITLLILPNMGKYFTWQLQVNYTYNA